MTDAASKHQLTQRLNEEDGTHLHITMAPQNFDSAFKNFVSLRPSSDGDEAASPIQFITPFVSSRSYATVPISSKPGSGDNFVHHDYQSCWKPRANVLCSATARLLDLQTLLELPLAVLGIRLTSQEDEHQQEHLWPDKKKVSAIEVVRLRRKSTERSSMDPTPLTRADLNGTVWDFMQPDQYVTVIVHIHIKSVTGKRRLSTDPALQSLINEHWPDGRNRKLPPALPRDPNFKVKVNPKFCVISGNSTVVEAAHIIQRSLKYDLVKSVMELLYSTISPATGTGPISALFSRRFEAMHEGVDDPANAILLSPSLHTVFDTRRTIWILRSRCYHLGQPTCYDEFRAFDPPCPSATAQVRNPTDDLALWEQQLVHEQKVVPRQCPNLVTTQECLLHLSALLSFFDLFMMGRPAVTEALAALRSRTNEDRASGSDDQSGSHKRQKTGKKQTDGGEARHEGRGPTAAEGSSGGSGGGSTSRLCDQQQLNQSSPASNPGWFPPERPASAPSSSAPSNECSPSSKRRRVDDNVAAPKTAHMSFTLTPVNSDVEVETGSDSDCDSQSRCEESDWDEDEERRQELLNSDTLALLLTNYNLTPGNRLICV